VSDQVLELTTAGRTVTFSVTAVAAGPSQVEAVVADADANAPDRSANGSLLLTVGARPGTSYAGVEGHRSDAVTLRPAAATTAAAAPGQICATGAFWVADSAGRWLPGRNVPVYVIGRVSSSGSTQTFASGLTDSANGAYNVCFTAPAAQVYSLSVRFTSSSALWRVTDNGGSTSYTVDTPVRYNVPAGTDQSFGSSAPGSIHMRGWHAFDTLNLLWFARSSGTGCWTARETSNCSYMTVHWQPGSTDGTYYHLGTGAAGSWVALADADADSEHLVLHDTGHAYQHILYGYWWPASDCPSPHYLHLRSGQMCAWTEGFANAVAGYLKGDGRFYWPNGAWMDLMQTNWNDPSRPASSTNPQDGEEVEARVAGSLIDLWRTADGGPGRDFDNIRLNRSSSFREWFNEDRPATGLDVSAATRDLVYTHTIDYRTGTIVANGGFESGTTGWSITGGVVGNWTAYPAQAGSWYAWMGGNGVTNTDTRSQQITVPSGVSTATLGFYLRIVTAETGSTVWDQLRVQVVDGTTTTTLGTWSNVNAGTSYGLRTLDLGGYRGRTVTLKFVSTEDSSLQTDFLIDTVGVTTT